MFQVHKAHREHFQIPRLLKLYDLFSNNIGHKESYVKKLTDLNTLAASTIIKIEAITYAGSLMLKRLVLKVGVSGTHKQKLRVARIKFGALPKFRAPLVPLKTVAISRPESKNGESSPKRVKVEKAGVAFLAKSKNDIVLLVKKQ